MVLMLWFYLSGLVILIGAEMNAEIEHASEYGKAEGEKVPGEKRKIGPALQRAWEARHRGKPKTPPPDAVPKAGVGAVAPLPRPATAYAPVRSGWSDWLIGAPVVLAQALWTLRSYKNRIKS